jgi:uncharacterized protein (DUF885 family)
MDDAAALRLLMDDGFQEQPEAEGKLRRAKLSVTQLCSYFVGAETWLRLRRELGERMGLRQFHDRALAEGPVALASLRALLTAR